MGRFRAKLIGESDNHSVSREFDDLERAKAWGRGDGLRDDFEDQTARLEIYDKDGNEVCRLPNLQTAEQRAREGRRDAYGLSLD
jgi:hypothetical protein